MLYISDDQMTAISLYYTTFLSLEVILISLYFANMLGGLINTIFSSKMCVTTWHSPVTFTSQLLNPWVTTGQETWVLPEPV
jgi:hypothetical protein